MSQKGEKYARRMERRVDKLEQDVAAITTEQTTQGVRISAVEDDLAVYRAAVSARELKQAAAEIKAAKERRTARAAERERKARRRNKVLAFIALALFVAVCVVMVAKAYSEEPAAEPAAPEASAAPAAIMPTELLFTAAEEEYMEDPQEAEKIEEALLAQGYFSLAVPMPYEWQDYMRTYCEEYGCPYPLALAVAQTESNFDMDAVGASGEVGIMQLNPGPGGSYHAEIQAATGPHHHLREYRGRLLQAGPVSGQVWQRRKGRHGLQHGRGRREKRMGQRDHLHRLLQGSQGGHGNMGMYGERLGRGVTREAARKYETSVTERARRERWQASGCARVVSRKYGTVVVPHGSNFAALLNAAEVWGCDWTEIRDAEVWRADKEERPVSMPHLI